MGAHREKVFCAFCKNPKYIRTVKHIGWTNVVICFVAALTSMFVFWQAFDPRFLLLWSVYLGIAEMFTYLMWRASVRCDTCAFDPVLYRSDPARASHIVKAHLEEMRASGRYLLRKNNPFANLPVQKRKVEPQAPKSGSPVVSPAANKENLLSRQI